MSYLTVFFLVFVIALAAAMFALAAAALEVAGEYIERTRGTSPEIAASRRVAALFFCVGVACLYVIQILVANL